MKKRIAIILVLVLCLSLTACGSKAAEMIPHTHGEITISIPEDYIDLSSEDFAEGLTFVYGLDPIAVNGLKEPKATFESFGLKLDLQTYAELLVKANNVNSAPEEKDGIWTFSYESGEYTYLVTLQETDEAFWTIQAYCPTAQYANVKNDMWDILSSVTV